MFKRILVPIGDSSHTTTALDNACRIAAFFKGEVHCLYVADVTRLKASFIASPEIWGMSLSPGIDTESVMEAAQEEMRQGEKKAVELFYQWKQQYPNLNITLKKMGSIIHEEIIKEQESYDLIVIAKQFDEEEENLGGIGEIFRKVLHKAVIPVLVSVKDNYVGTNLLACYDGKKPSRKALEVAIEVAKQYAVPLTVLTTDEYNIRKAKRISKEAVEIAREKGLGGINPIAKQLNTVGAILGEVSHLEIDFLFMGAYGDNPIKDLLLGSTTDEILRQSSCPTLLCR